MFVSIDTNVILRLLDDVESNENNPFSRLNEECYIYIVMRLILEVASTTDFGPPYRLSSVHEGRTQLNSKYQCFTMTKSHCSKIFMGKFHIFVQTQFSNKIFKLVRVKALLDIGYF